MSINDLMPIWLFKLVHRRKIKKMEEEARLKAEEFMKTKEGKEFADKVRESFREHIKELDNILGKQLEGKNGNKLR